MSRLSQKVRKEVFVRAQHRCEYCQTPKSIVITMEIDHIVPLAAHGTDSLDNLCLSCISCNSHKGSFQSGVDPETRQEMSLFNPRLQIWKEHFSWNKDGNILLGLTPTGRATIEKLKINRQELAEARLRWVAVGWHPPK